MKSVGLPSDFAGSQMLEALRSQARVPSAEQARTAGWAGGGRAGNATGASDFFTLGGCLTVLPSAERRRVV